MFSEAHKLIFELEKGVGNDAIVEISTFCGDLVLKFFFPKEKVFISHTLDYVLLSEEDRIFTNEDLVKNVCHIVNKELRKYKEANDE